jgi:hypothetical protein
MNGLAELIAKLSGNTRQNVERARQTDFSNAPVMMGDASNPAVHAMLRQLLTKSGLKGVLKMNATEMKGLDKTMPTMADPEVTGLVDMAQKFPAQAAGRTYNALRGLPGADHLPTGAAAATGQATGQVSLKQLIDGMVENVNRTGASGQKLMNPRAQAKELDALVEFMTQFAKKSK